MAVSIGGVGYSIEEETEIDVADDSAWDRTAIATIWATAHSYVAGAQIRPTIQNNYVYECTTPGTSGESEPVWGTTPGGTTSDGTVVWTCYHDRTIAANRTGLAFNIFACAPLSGKIPTFILSSASSAPVGYASTNSRQISGFSCECAGGTRTANHALSGYISGDILPRSIWDLKHRSSGLQAGMVWAGKTDYDSINHAPLWVTIHHLSGTGATIASVFGAAPTVSRSYYQFFADLNLVGMRMLTGDEFSKLHKGTPEETNIFGSSAPTTCGGHIDTSSVLIESDIGLWGMSGELWTWTSDQRLALNGEDFTAAKVYAWDNIPAGVGSDYGQCLQNAVVAGGNWDGAAGCGSRARFASYRRSGAYAYIGCRAVAEPQ
jgi:hypothetical protein